MYEILNTIQNTLNIVVWGRVQLNKIYKYL